METKNTNGRIIAGILVLIIGIALLINNFDFVQFPIKHYIFSWKTLLIGIGIVIIATKKNYTSGAFLIGLGTIFWLPEIFGFQFSLQQVFWPALLIVFGTVLILKTVVPCNRDYFKHHRKGVCEAEIISTSESKEV